jgi:hypothetical protein
MMEFKKIIKLSEDKIPVNEEVFKKYIHKHGATACGYWLENDCNKCIDNCVNSEEIQFNCDKYKETFDFSEALANSLGQSN